MTDAVSLWRNADADRTRVDTFRFTTRDKNPDVVRVSPVTWADVGLPDDVEDWPVVVTKDGDHIHGEVLIHDRTAGSHRLRLTRRNPMTLTPYP